MTDALVIGGTRFIGRHAVEDLLAAGYDVTTFNRGRHPNPFEDDDRVEHVAGDRSDDTALEDAANEVEPAIVLDMVAYFPRDVTSATTIFTDVDAYVYVSSGGVYDEEVVPKREDETSLEPCSPTEATDDSRSTYGARKAEGDRAVVEAAAAGVNAMSVRPCIVYGPFDYTERFDFWLHCVATDDRVLVPGDGQQLWHRAYVEDVARALRIVAEAGEPGETYNVGDRRLLTLEETVELAARTMGREIEVVTAGSRALSVADLEPADFVLYRDYPHVLSTAKLAELGWSSTPVETAMKRTVDEHLESDRDGAEYHPGRDALERVLGVLETI